MEYSLGVTNVTQFRNVKNIISISRYNILTEP